MRENILRIKENMKKVIIGKDEVMDRILTALLSGGHVLLEDLPGTGKTVLAKSLAKSMNGEFRRVQFTPDLLPSDVTGLHYFIQREGEFQFREGPVFTQILLADEINRATPRTQSSLLECMEERQVTIDGETRKLDEVFFVIATQNPIESSGTFPLPEAQMDRFFMKLSMGFPSKEEELAILDRFQLAEPLKTLEPVCTREEILEAMEEIRKIYVHPEIKKYLVDIAEASRQDGELLSGVSPRGTLALFKGIRAYAWLKGRDYVVPEDVKALAVPVLAHRLVLAGAGDTDAERRVMEEILKRVEVPVEDWKKNETHPYLRGGFPSALPSGKGLPEVLEQGSPCGSPFSAPPSQGGGGSHPHRNHRKQESAPGTDASGGISPGPKPWDRRGGKCLPFRPAV